MLRPGLKHSLLWIPPLAALRKIFLNGLPLLLRFRGLIKASWKALRAPSKPWGVLGGGLENPRKQCLKHVIGQARQPIPFAAIYKLHFPVFETSQTTESSMRRYDGMTASKGENQKEGWEVLETLTHLAGGPPELHH